MIRPILFNTEMVTAILEDRKTATRRLVKPQPEKDMKYKQGILVMGGAKKDYGKFGFATREWGGRILYARPPALVGDILYVRETWNFVYEMDGNDQQMEETGHYVYYADVPMPFSCWIDSVTGEHKDHMPWRPSIHMPKEAARIWLKVTEVRVERLQEMTASESIKEGIRLPKQYDTKERAYILKFADLWDSVIKKSDMDIYGWEANPWVWVIEFEKTGKPEGWCI